MDLLWMINKIRYMKPIENFLEIKSLVLPMAFFGTVLNWMIDLFHTDWDLVFILIVAMIIDAITGIIASKRRKNPLNSLGFRQSIIKFIEYSVFILIMVLIANGFEKYSTGDIGFLLKESTYFLKDVDVFAFLTLIWIEVVSISENLIDKKGSIKKLVNKIIRKINKNE